MPEDEEPLNKKDVQELIQCVKEMREDIDTLKVDINPVLTHDPIEIENRLSSLEGKMKLLLIMLPSGMGLLGVLLTILLG